jgi:hypothetical protein
MYPIGFSCDQRDILVLCPPPPQRGKVRMPGVYGLGFRDHRITAELFLHRQVRCTLRLAVDAPELHVELHDDGQFSATTVKQKLGTAKTEVNHATA